MVVRKNGKGLGSSQDRRSESAKLTTSVLHEILHSNRNDRLHSNDSDAKRSADPLLVELLTTYLSRQP